MSPAVVDETSGSSTNTKWPVSPDEVLEHGPGRVTQKMVLYFNSKYLKVTNLLNKYNMLILEPFLSLIFEVFSTRTPWQP